MQPTEVLCGWTRRQPLNISPEGAYTLQRWPDPLALNRGVLRAIRGWQEAGGVASLVLWASAAIPVPAE